MTARRGTAAARNILRIALPFLVVLAAWQAVSSLKLFPDYLFPSTLAVAKDLVKKGIHSQILLLHCTHSLIRLFLGYLLGVFGGMAMGMAIGLNRSVSGFIKPLVDFGHAIPGIAWLPLAILWLGIGVRTMVFMVSLVVFFPVLYGTLTGLRMLPAKYTNVGLMCGATKRQILSSVLLPGALPSILNGVRVGAAYGWRGLIGVEMLVASTGIGWLIIDARAWLQTETVIAGALVIGVIWVCLDRLVLKTLEARTVERWGMVRKDGID